jgi:hypothetical protein
VHCKAQGVLAGCLHTQPLLSAIVAHWYGGDSSCVLFFTKQR